MKTVPPFRAPTVCACGDHGFVGLTKGRVALFDADAVPVVSLYRWLTLGSKPVYHYAAVLRDGRLHQQMHRLLLGLSPTDRRVADHINGDTLDNRSANLRACTRSENSQNGKIRSHNRSGLKGVFASQHGGWLAAISVDGRKLHLGTFPTPQAAALEYDAAALSLHGAFARTNASMGLI